MLSFTIQWLTESLTTVEQITRITLTNCPLYLVFLDIRRWRLRTVLLRCDPCKANTSRLNATLNKAWTIRAISDDVIMGDSNISGNTYNSQNFEQPPSLNSSFESLKMQNILKLSQMNSKISFDDFKQDVLLSKAIFAVKSSPYIVTEDSG